MRYKYTDKEIKTLIKSIVILEDSNEQENSHIIDFFEKKKLKYKRKKLNFGDYSFFLPENKELGIERDIYFDDEICVERKNSLSEIAGNFGKGRKQFENELIRKKDCKMFLMIEDGSWEKINAKLYRADYTVESFLATLYVFIARYNISVDFISKELAGQFIYSMFYYYIREYLKNYKGE